MAHKSRLIGQCNFNIAINDHALATQSRVDARVNGTVDKIFFFIRYFLDVIHPLIYVDVAGAAAANAAAVMLQFDAVLQANVQH